MIAWQSFIACGALFFICALCGQSAADTSLTLDQPECAGISGFRRMWDTPVVCSADGFTKVVDKGPFGKAPSAFWAPEQRKNGENGALVFDAIHRSLLVRFPNAAERIAEQVGKGQSISKVELVLPFKGCEFWPEGYVDPSGMSFMGDRWVKNPPNWHALVWGLRKPWKADPEIGPTFNAFINGLGYWKKFGAQDEDEDRFAMRFGPAEVSQRNPEGRVDVTAFLTSEDFGKTPAERLRVLTTYGFLLRKWETYDTRYKDGWNGYEYGPATGGRGLLIDTPRLELTFTPRPSPNIGRGDGGEGLNFAARVHQLRQKPQGKPTAVMPTAEELKTLADKFASRKLTWMPEWQWQRVQELANADSKHSAFQFPADLGGYGRWLDEILARPYRNFIGHLTPFTAIEALKYGDAWPAPVLNHMKKYWEEWLMTDRRYTDLVHPQGIYGDDNQKYLARTGDWRGNTSFYRAGYTRELSTMNFNHLAVTGALLGGSLIGSEYAMEDGRYGLENLPLRLWCWYDGSTQESIDHYYLALTLLAQKEFANWGPTVLDRMMGRSMLTKTVDELCSTYHPGLRRFISTSGRTGLAYLFAIQDGTKHIVHTLSRSGAITDLGKEKTVGDMPVLGHDGPPAQIAEQALLSPFADEWFAYTVDEKPLPFEMTCSYKMWGGFAATPLQRRTYMGANYGLASQDVSVRNECVPIMAQWRREAKQAQTAEEIGTLTVRYGVNQTNLLDSLYHGTKQANGNGSVHTYGSGTYAMQYKNKLLVLTSPNRGLKTGNEYPGTMPTEAKSLQTTIGLMNFQPQPTWEIYVDDQRVTAYPARVKAGQRISIKDGVSYIGILPLPSTDLGRSEEVVITNDTGPEVQMQGGGKTRPALLIEQYNYKSDAPLPKEKWDSDEIDLAYGGFAIEVGDVKEFGSFAQFQKHLKSTSLKAQWDAEKKLLNVSLKIGADTLECGYRPQYANGGTDQCFPYRRVNGEYPYLPMGMERDSTLAQAGRLGRLEKNSAVVLHEPGRMAYLQTEPTTGTFAEHNPLPDPAFWSMSVPGGIEVTADGRLGMARVVARPKENKLWIDYALKEDQKNRADMATALLVTGMKNNPVIELNGQPLRGKVETLTLDSKQAHVVPLVEGENLPLAARHSSLVSRYTRARAAFKALVIDKVDPNKTMLQDWWLIGPCPGEQAKLFETVFEPEKLMGKDGIIDVAKKITSGGKELEWKRTLAEGQPALGTDPINLGNRFQPNNNVCAYAYTTVTSDADRDALLLTGSDDTITVWLNGEKVVSLNVWRGMAPDQDRAAVKLRRGVNHLLVKCCQAGGGWGFFLRIGDEFGVPVQRYTNRR